MSDLKHCPFCGGNDLVVRNDYSEDDPTHSYAMHIFCRDCHAHGRNNFPIGWAECEESARDAWNLRADQPRSKWQDISTAPTDGTEILGFGSASWKGKRYAPARHVAWFADGKWWGRDPDAEAGLHLTHWQHMPTSPRDKN